MQPGEAVAPNRQSSHASGAAMDVSPRLPWWLVAGVGVVAFMVPLVPVTRGGGLHSLINYDGAVYYAASAGLAHGRLPYRDFLLLHPPGITLALLPFTMLGRLVGDPTGMLAARLGFMVLGAVNAGLVMRLLRPLGLVAALFGGLFYGVFFPSAFMHRTVTLEGVSATCLIGAMVLAARWQRGRAVRWRSVVGVGVLLGVATTIKMWGVVMFVALLAWAVIMLGLRRSLAIVAGTAAAGIAICGPFLAQAPRQMWEMVVVAQLGRDPRSAAPLVRVTEIIGLAILPGRGNLAVIALGLVLALGACALALRTREGRLGVLVLATAASLLILTPTWFLQYTGLSAAPAAVVAGAAVAVLLNLLAARRLRLLVTGAAFIGITGYAAAMMTATWGEPFPGRSLARVLDGTPGCVTTDHPIALIETDLLRRNLDRGCPLVVDLGGYSYVLPSSRGGHRYVVRDRHQPWQRFALTYLSSGEATIQLRHKVGNGFTRRTVAVVESWPIIARIGPYTVRHPVPSAR